jgi:hypothetical protein
MDRLSRYLLTQFVAQKDDHESRIRDLYTQLAERPTKDDLRSQRNLIIGVVTVVVLVVGGIVGLVAALVGG